MKFLWEIGIAMCILSTASGQLRQLPQSLSRLWGGPDIAEVPTPNLPPLPQFQDWTMPEKFLENLLNATGKELVDVVTQFTFEEISGKDVRFFLFNKNGSYTVHNVYSNKYHIENTSEPIKFFIHGWQSTGDPDFVKNMVQSYNSIGIYNVFSVDWSSHAQKNYLYSSRGTKNVGEFIGNFIVNLVKKDMKLLRNIHIIGHSLGAHVAGFAGKRIMDLTKGKKVGRITGLDAAAPLFEFPVKVPGHLRLSKGDADYVDGIHTNVGFLGFLAPYADADFYVDFGGPIQTGCDNPNVFEAYVCSHLKSNDIFNRTITSKTYLATFCENPLMALANMCNWNKKVVMGEHASKNANGEFFIKIDGNNLPET